MAEHKKRGGITGDFEIMNHGLESFTLSTKCMAYKGGYFLWLCDNDYHLISHLCKQRNEEVNGSEKERLTNLENRRPTNNVGASIGDHEDAMTAAPCP